MNTTMHTTTAADADTLRTAVATGDVERAEKILGDMGRSVPADALEPAAELHMHRGRWREAMRLLNRVIDAGPACRMKQTLARNMAALREHRPAVCKAVGPVLGNGRYRVAASPSGLPTVAFSHPNGKSVSLSPGNDPAAGLNQAIAALDNVLSEGEPLALLSIADGYLLSHLAANPPRLLMTARQSIYLFERDPSLLAACLMIHDYSGPAGPIRDERFHWFVGPDCAEAFRETMLSDVMLPFPMRRVAAGIDMPPMQKRMEELAHEHVERGTRTQREIDIYYDDLSAERLAGLLADAEDRSEERDAGITRGREGADRTAGPPRVLLVTTRFSTVLQYSTRDIAEAFERNGWQTELLIEPTDHHRITRPAIQETLTRFQPDLVFQIDHLRSEYEGLYPPNLPFVCWIQDHLKNLTSREAGASIGRRDFVLTSVTPMYAELHGYPRRQMIDVVKLTRVPERPASWRSDGEDLVYVSNASRDIGDMVDQTIAPAGSNEPLRRLISTCCDRMIETYRSGGSLPTLWHVRRLMEQVEAEAGFTLHDPQHRQHLLWMLHHPLNDALYRQQALRWVAAAAEELGLTLGLYGRGWDRHGEFAPFARGPVAYGADLERLTRRSRINLQIIPSFCLHQRMLDGLAAGGFFLVRHHPSDTLLPEAAAFIEHHLDPSVRSVKEARRALDPDRREMFEDLLRRAECVSEIGVPTDLIERVRGCRAAELLDASTTALPRYDEVAFHDEPTLRACVERFVGDDAARKEIAETQRRAVEHRLTYEAGTRRVVRKIGTLIREEVGESGVAPAGQPLNGGHETSI